MRIWRGLGGMVTAESSAMCREVRTGPRYVAARPAEALDSPAMRARFKPLLAVAVLALALTCAAPALAQNAPTLGQETTQTQTAAPPDTGTNGGNGGLKSWQEVLIFFAGLALLAGIAFAIVGDARDRARRLGHGREPEAATAGGPHKHRAQAKARARAKSRQARAQRRRNR
jgi:hypothetical protein